MKRRSLIGNRATRRCRHPTTHIAGCWRKDVSRKCLTRRPPRPPVGPPRSLFPKPACAWYPGVKRGSRSRAPAHFRDPPPHTDEEKPPVVKELRRLPLERVPYELEDPPEHEQGERGTPKAGQKNRNRDDDQRNTHRVAKTIHRMVMAGRVLRNPLVGC